MKELLTKAEITHKLTKSEIIQLLSTDAINEELFKAADRVRKQYVGDAVHLRALIEFSNYCRQNCCYCGLRHSNEKIDRYRLDAATIIEFAENAKNMGYKTVVLQSGEDMSFTADKLIFIITGPEHKHKLKISACG